MKRVASLDTERAGQPLGFLFSSDVMAWVHPDKPLLKPILGPLLDPLLNLLLDTFLNPLLDSILDPFLDPPLDPLLDAHYLFMQCVI